MKWIFGILFLKAISAGRVLDLDAQESIGNAASIPRDESKVTVIRLPPGESIDLQNEFQNIIRAETEDDQSVTQAVPTSRTTRTRRTRRTPVTSTASTVSVEEDSSLSTTTRRTRGTRTTRPRRTRPTPTEVTTAAPTAASTSQDDLIRPLLTQLVPEESTDVPVTITTTERVTIRTTRARRTRPTRSTTAKAAQIDSRADVTENAESGPSKPSTTRKPRPNLTPSPLSGIDAAIHDLETMRNDIKETLELMETEEECVEIPAIPIPSLPPPPAFPTLPPLSFTPPPLPAYQVVQKPDEPAPTPYEQMQKYTQAWLDLLQSNFNRLQTFAVLPPPQGTNEGGSQKTPEEEVGEELNRQLAVMVDPVVYILGYRWEEDTEESRKKFVDSVKVLREKLATDVIAVLFEDGQLNDILKSYDSFISSASENEEK